jgi:cytochrome c553
MEPYMKFTRILGFATVALIAAAATAQQSVTVVPVAETKPAPVASLDTKPAVKGDISRGQAKSGTCAACHGVDGNAADPQYPKLAGQHELYIARHLALFKQGDRINAVMAPNAMGLSNQDMRDIGAYYASQKILAGIADDSVVKEGPYKDKKYYQIGQRVYRGGKADGTPACIACHGPTGSGIPGPTYPALGGQHASYTAKMLTDYRTGLVLGKGEQAKTVMKAAAKNLSDEEIQGLATYIQGLHNAADAKTLAKK